jgi:hypothetical protein
MNTLNSKLPSFLKSTKFGQLTLWESIITVATMEMTGLWLKYTKFDFGRGTALDPAGGAFSALQTL